VFVALGIQNAMRMCHIVICSLRGSTIFYTLPRKRHDCRKKKVTEHKMCVLIFCTLVWNNSHPKNNSAKYYQKRTLVFAYSACSSCQILMKLQFSRQIFKKYSNIKFHENPSSGSQLVPCRRTNGQTDGRIYSHDETNSHFFAAIDINEIKD